MIGVQTKFRSLTAVGTKTDNGNSIKGLQFRYEYRGNAAAGSLLDLLLEQLHFALEVDVVEPFQILVADLLHVQAVHRTDVHALLTSDALRVVEFRDDDRLACPIVRTVEHVDASGPTLALALAASDADVHLEDRVLPDAVDRHDLFIRVLF